MATTSIRTPRPETPMTPRLVVASSTCGPFVVTHFVQPAGLHIPPHEHAEATLAIVLDGEMVDTFARSSLRLTQGAAVARPAGEPHAHRYGAGGVDCVAVSVSADGLRRLEGITSLFAAVGHFRAGVSARGLLAELSARDAVRELALEARVLELVVGLSRRRPPGGAPPRWLLRVRDLLHDEPAAHGSLVRLAREAGVHEGHLARVFRDHFGCSVGAYARARRIELAAEWLRTSERSISEIAASAGFYDQSHFTKVFHRMLGATPAEWRRREG
jgi:AraC family transcriptional regulator